MTKTDRYYDKDVVDDHDCKYLKLACKGHGECPSQEIVTTFIGIADKFIRQKPLELIGIHCTHGFNRTGFLIVSYLVEVVININLVNKIVFIEVEDWSVEAAINTFANSRPPGIYKQDYLAELYNRYGDPEDVTRAPEMPDWCFEDAELDDRDDAEEALRAANNEDVISGDSKKPFIPDYDITGVSIVRGIFIHSPFFFFTFD